MLADAAFAALSAARLRLTSVAIFLEAVESLYGSCSWCPDSQLLWPTHLARVLVCSISSLIAILVIYGTRCCSTARFAYLSAKSLESLSSTVRKLPFPSLSLPTSATEECAGIHEI